MGIILAYDCTDENSFTNVRNWIQQIKMHASENVAKVLIGNKCDRPDKKVSAEQGEALARELGVKFFESSAKNNINVQEVFYYVAKDIKDKRMGDPMGTNPAIRVSAAPSQQKAGGKGCCK